MAYPVLIAGGIAAGIGAAGAGIQLAKKIGQNQQGSTSFERTQGYDPNASRFGGSEGGLNTYVNSVDERRALVEGANGTSIFYSAQPIDREGM